MIRKQDLLGIGMTSQRRRDTLIKRLSEQGIHDERVLDMMSRMPRHLFLDEAMANRAYEDCALPIGHGQTISQPFIVARMTEMVLGDDIKNPPKKVLEVGTGSGYQAAILAMLVDEMYSVERIKALYEKTQHLLNKQLKLDNLHLQYSDGGWGWPEHAPYDAIIVTAAAPEIPDSLLQQLSIGGRIIIPVGAASATQTLYKVTRIDKEHYEKEVMEAVSFVPFLKGCG